MRVNGIKPVDTLTMLAIIADELVMLLGGKKSRAWMVDAITEKEAEKKQGATMSFESPDDFKKAWQASVERMQNDG